MKCSLIAAVAGLVVGLLGGVVATPHPEPSPLLGINLGLNVNLDAFIGARAGCGGANIRLSGIAPVRVNGLIDLRASVSLNIGVLADVRVGLFSRRYGPIYNWPSSYRFSSSTLAVQLSLLGVSLSADVRAANDLFVAVWVGEHYTDGYVWPWSPRHFGYVAIDASAYVA